MEANLKMLEILKKFKKEIKKNIDGVDFDSVDIYGLLEGLEDDIYEIKNELKEK